MQKEQKAGSGGKHMPGRMCSAGESASPGFRQVVREQVPPGSWGYPPGTLVEKMRSLYICQYRKDVKKSRIFCTGIMYFNRRHFFSRGIGHSDGRGHVPLATIADLAIIPSHNSLNTPTHPDH
jgi:hypothetical protein